MDSKEFVQAYPRTPIKIEAPGEIGADTFVVAQKYADVFSLLLHDTLTGVIDPDSGAAIKETLSGYPHFITHDLRALDTQLYTEGTQRSMARLNEINFHWLNYAMLPMWQLFFSNNSVVSPKDRLNAVKMSQDLLAYDGCFQYFYRDKLAGANSGYRYFGDDMLDFRHTHESRLHERDTAIALLDIAKRDPSLIILPAPGKFEHSHNGAINADFIVLDATDHRAVGVQVKTRVKPEHEEKYDDKHIVLIDGSADLGNYRFLRTTHSSSHKRQVSWAGILSVEHMKNLQTQGPYTTPITNMYPIKSIVQTQFSAKARLGKIKVNRKEISELLEAKIRAKL